MSTNKTQAEQFPQDAVMQSVLKNQVRIGNLVDFNGQVEIVYAIRNSGVDFYRGKTKKSVIMQSYVWEAIKPIPLTEEILFKFGYLKKHDIYYKNNSLLKFIGNEVFYLRGEIDDSEFHEYITSVKYVHELQNIHFALTHRELTVA